MLGEKSARLIANNLASKPPDELSKSFERYLTTIADRIPPDLHQPYQKIHVSVVNQNEPNAFSTFGGQVIFTTGILESVESENGLTFILGHELRHLHHRHVTRGVGRGLVSALIQYVLAAGGMGSADSTYFLLLPTQLAFSRQQELEADAWGIKVLERVYGHTGGAEEFFQHVLSTSGESHITSLMHTHPMPSERIEAIMTNQAYPALVPLPTELKRNK